MATVPPFAFVGAAVNNDVLAWLGGGVLLLGLARRLEGRVDSGTGALVGAGLALALLAKATAGLLALLVASAALLLARRQARAGAGVPFVLPVVVGLLLPAFHWLPVLLRYGTPVPSLEVVDPEAFSRSAFVAPAGGELLALLPWLWKMTRLAASTALSIVSHAWVPVGPPASLAGPALLAGLALLGLLPAAARPGRDGSGERALARAGLLALAATFALNLLWARAAYLETGRLGGIHARYYLPLLPCVALAVSLGLERLPARGLLAAALVLLLVLFDAGVATRFLALFAGP